MKAPWAGSSGSRCGGYSAGCAGTVDRRTLSRDPQSALLVQPSRMPTDASKRGIPSVNLEIDLTGLVLPERIEIAEESADCRSADFVLEPLERGYGHTLGNAVRRSCCRRWGLPCGPSGSREWCTNTRRFRQWSKMSTR